jgi:hypothetical protein
MPALRRAALYHALGNSSTLGSAIDDVTLILGSRAHAALSLLFGDATLPLA